MKSIIVPLACGPASLFTAKYALYLGKILGVKVVGVYVVDEKSLQDLLKSRVFVEIEAKEYEIDMEEQGRYFLDRVKGLAAQKNVAFEGVILKGVIHEEVVKRAYEISADLLVMGDLKEVLSWQEAFHSEGERIFRESPCPVVVVKNPQEAERLYREI